MNHRAILCLSFIVATTQLSLRGQDGEEEPDHNPLMDFGGIFDMHDAIQEHFERQATLADKDAKDESMQLIGGRRREDGPEETPSARRLLSEREETASEEATPSPTGLWKRWHPGMDGEGAWDFENRDWGDRKSWPSKAWKAPLAPDDNYPGKAAWPLDATTMCTAADVKELNFWALKQAKKRLPREGYNGTNFNGECFRYFFNDWRGGAKGGSLNVTGYAKCFQKWYNVTTGCAQCVGKVYNMAFFNWSQPCYDFCKGRPNRRDGSHWCWEDCQSCMWYIGKQLTTCYGEPYDMQCRYARELGKEEWFEQNGINPKR